MRLFVALRALRLVDEVLAHAHRAEVVRALRGHGRLGEEVVADLAPQEGLECLQPREVGQQVPREAGGRQGGGRGRRHRGARGGRETR